MIWVEGRIVTDDALMIPALDRTFEHGLGLFETLRTWGGRPTLLESHRARMLRSAAELGIPIDPTTLPDAEAVRKLLEAEGNSGDRMIRITATAGTDSGRSVVWMRSAPLPPIRPGGVIVGVNAWTLPAAGSGSSSPPSPGEGRGTASLPPHVGPISPPSDFTARHKTLNYWFKRAAFERAHALGYDETLILADPWGYLEASRSNLFVVVGDELFTITTDAPIVPGIMRRLVLEVAGNSGLEPREVCTLGSDRLEAADEVFLTNAVRGIVPVAKVDSPFATIDRPAPGPRTARVQELIARRLWPDRGMTP